MPIYPVKDNKPTRNAFGEAMAELGQSNPDVVVLCADLKGSLKLEKFSENHPDRYFSIGIAEADMIGTAAGLAIGGKIPFTATFAEFSTGRVYDQIRQSVAYSNTNVKICASHAGLTLGEDGATHQALEDIGLMRALPGMTVIVPCDANETYSATMAIAKFKGPVYLRFGRPNQPNFTEINPDFQIGKANVLNPGKDVTIIATGILVWKALEAAEILQAEGLTVRVINIHTIKPLDVEAIVTAAKETGAIVTAEEHQKNTGLGDAVAHVISTQFPVPLEIVAVNDTFGESGLPDELLTQYGLSTQDLVKAAKKAISRKK
ncbi:MAG: transketolase family protein [Bacteroidetes bacterium]|nr:transketolase family protein [Bacteroidota bacterium]